VASVVVTVVPLALLAFAVWRAWNSTLHWPDLLVLAVTYVLTGLGITLGYHRLFTHRSFRTSPLLRGVIGALGSAAVEGPIIEWAARHRRHHTFSDQPGDPHSPHTHDGHGWWAALRGLFFAHVGWTFQEAELANEERYARDLRADRVVRFVDRTFLVWVLVGLAFPFGLGVALTGSVVGGLTALLWGGAVRIFLLHHATFSINSLCHFFGAQHYDTGDESRNLAWLAVPTLGEAWHNNHHAFPTAASHGMGRQLDPTALVIRALERLGLVWDVVRIEPGRRTAKAASAAA
jgi:stearoyl-CoA desaturase (delta-9 desaturase)